MESFLKLLPRKSYNTFGVIFLAVFVLIGIAIIGIASDFESKATLQCNPEKTIASDLPTRKFIDTQCFLKYTKEFYPFLSLHNLFMINFGLVILLNIIYAYSVKHRVEIFVNFSSTRANGVEDESQPLSGISEAASDPLAHQNSGRYSVFELYVTHLLVFRVIPSVIFAALLITSSSFPVQFYCQWPPDTSSTSPANFTQSQVSNSSSFECTYPMGRKNEKLTATVVTVNFVYGIVALTEFTYLLWSAWKDHTLCTDMEFCCVYLLRKRKRIRKLIKKIRENISSDIFYLHDDFGDQRLSRRKLEEMYVNVIITEGRESRWYFTDQFERHQIYEGHLSARFNMSTADFNNIYEYICSRPSDVILVFDGLDELKTDINIRYITKEKLRSTVTMTSHISSSYLCSW